MQNKEVRNMTREEILRFLGVKVTVTQTPERTEANLLRRDE